MQSAETRTEKSTGKVYQVDQHSIEAAFRERINEVDRTVTKADFQRWLPSTNEYRLQDILYIACRSTAQSSDSASVLKLGKYNRVRETYVLGDYEWDSTQLTYTIDDYRRRQTMPTHQRKLPSMPSHERKHHPTLLIPTTTYTEIYKLRVWMVGGVWVRKWRSGGYGSSYDVSFCSFVSFSSLLFSSSLLWISARYKCRRHGFLPSANGDAFPRAPDPRKGCHWAIPIGCGPY